MKTRYLQMLFIRSLSFIFLFTAHNAAYAKEERPLAKYEPEQQVLLFIGQDNESMGGTKQWTNGYTDVIGTPAGVTHYVYLSEGKINNSGHTFSKGSVDGLNTTTSWNGGPMCMRCYVESDHYKNTVIHLSISMEHDDEPLVASGAYDHNIEEMISFLKEFQQFPFLIRIGYEFDGSWNSYEPQAFQQAFRRIVDKLRAANVTNFATVMASIGMETDRAVWEAYWPGDEYVDWVGYSYWSGGSYSNNTLDFAREKGKPVFIAEATTRGFDIANLGGMFWGDWFGHFFKHVEDNQDIIKAISYISADWETHPMWIGQGWGNSRVDANPTTLKQWQEKIAEPLYLSTPDGVYNKIRFTP